MQSRLGEKLKKIREERGISLEEAAGYLKIKKEYLQFIESSTYQHLPGDVYVRGFLRAYARFLRVKEDDVLRLYQHEREQGWINFQKQETRSATSKKRALFIFSGKILALLLVALLIIFLGGYFYYGVNKFKKTPYLVITQPPKQMITEERWVEVKGTTDLGNQITVNGEQVAVDSQGNFSQRINLATGLNHLTVKAVNRFNRTAVKEVDILVKGSEEEAMTQRSNSEATSPATSSLELITSKLTTTLWTEIAEEQNSLKMFSVSFLITKDAPEIFLKARRNDVAVQIVRDYFYRENKKLFLDKEQKISAQEMILLLTENPDDVLVKLNVNDQRYTPLAELINNDQALVLLRNPKDNLVPPVTPESPKPSVKDLNGA